MAVKDWIRFQRAFGFGTVRAAQALELWNSPAAIFAPDSDKRKLSRMPEMDRELIKLAKAYSPEPILDFCNQNGIRILTPDEEDYPESLRQIYSPPAVLYVAGHWENLDDTLRIAVVGSRGCTEYGDGAARAIAGELAQKGVITVSGLAAGIDSCCHDATVKAGGKTIAVQGCGIDVTYPATNDKLKNAILESGGAVLSEFPPGDEPLAFHFPIRNRIIAGLCQGTVVVEGRKKSGSLITAGFALTEGRDVFAVPSNVDQPLSQAPNWLIREGAIMVRGAEDILEEYENIEFRATYAINDSEYRMTTFHKFAQTAENNKKEKLPRSQPPTDNLNEKQRQVYEVMDKTPKSVDEIVQELALPVKSVLAVLTQLEIFGMIKVHAGHRFSR